MLFKIAILILGLIAIVSTFVYQNNAHTNALRQSAFEVCMNTVSPDILEDIDVLKANLSICNDIAAQMDL